MTEQVAFSLRGRNPDVLNCIANLSSDEVFTPPELAKEMLDRVAAVWAEANDGADIWADSSVRFLDPFAKSGVYLREITAKLIDGLAAEIPDLQQRVDHILTKQVFGIATTLLTSLISRRSVYCSKSADGKHSVATSFSSEAGNIWFERMEHTWAGATEFIETADENGDPIRRGTNGRCVFCNASQQALDRGGDLESHAYAFIHTNDIKARIAELFGEDMQFDVIIGNPPYQLQSDGGTRDIPIYQHFVEQAKRLAPRYLAMVIPSRWMASGLGLTEFRKTMLADRHIRELVDYPNAAEVFPSVGINGGACYFLWDSSHDGDCSVTTVRAGEAFGPIARPLDEYDVLVRDGRALTILRKVLDKSEPSVNTILARDKEFGWTSNFDGFHADEKPGDVALYYIRAVKRGKGFIARDQVTKSTHLIDTWKLLVPKVGSGRERERSGVDLVLGPPQAAPSPSVCTQSFLFFYVDSEAAVRSVRSYYSTKFFRFLVSLRKITQDATHGTYTWVPLQTWDRIWTDAELYAKYGLTDDEIAYIESLIRPMDLPDE
ncbi:Eco57I restriction-modification methylase domain-containing protein [Mycobacteroides abscessus]|uniref:Eco57I restriction-modification methylase domain-containing protein n=1 Tax=Mycobacteroides abscessus TaxID=36809 RepID=UPI0007F960E2|nr:Eco57I restriction-modification methylase domain-containing protein [Mycobacteroides abscessus]ANO13110.1 restriction endonuclease [Mycobacteroides abscessus]MDM2050247.1 Eco57I restriction-modification methylase domain-containing protein [Mycobacteroides abscessus]MDM2055166.1 Eco57I restriction-modification methylase domain-containing protein [Mycobacteroides abscessus]MDM2059857.1 Eco57I restriction-modification methylase domain-containing protein [Mycobacteroides abscessus]MDM2064010.1 